MAQDVLITPASTKIAFTDSGDTTTVLRTSSGRFEFKDSGESNFVDIYANDIVLDGNLTVGGTTTTVNTSNILIEDPILQLAKGQTSGSPTVDIGFVGLRGDSNNAAFIWDESADQFAAILTTGDGSSTTLTPASYAGFKAGASFFTGGITVENSLLRITSAAPNLVFSVPSGGLDSRIFNDGSGNFIIGHGDNSDTPTERLRITNTGNVGIGTASPGARLHVQGTESKFSAPSPTSDAHYLRLKYDNSEGIVDANRGNLKLQANSDIVYTSNKFGIGTNSPSRRLEVVDSSAAQILAKGWGPDSAGNDGGAIQLGEESAFHGLLSYDNATSILYIDNAYNSSNGDIRFRTKTSSTAITPLTIKGGGSVGIGTTSPSTYLDVEFSDTTSYASGNGNSRGLDITNAATDNNTQFASLQLATLNNTNGTGSLVRIHAINENSTAGASSMAFTTRNASSTISEKMRIKGDGNVGIGTTSPTLGKLQVVGSGSSERYLLALQSTNNHAQLRIISEASTYSSYIFFQDNSGAADRYVIQADVSDNLLFRPQGTGTAANQIVFNSVGNVGIGTTSPGKKLQISAGDGGHLLLQYSGSTGNSGAVRQIFQRSTGTEASPAGTNDGTIIGTTSYVAYAPSGSSYRNSAAIIVTRHGAANTVSAPAKIALATPGTADDTLVDRLTILPGGNVGLGTNAPESLLHVYGWTIIESASNFATLRLKSTTGSWDIDNNNGTFGLQWAGGDKFNITSAGSVGIGTTSPSSKLHVNSAGSDFSLRLSSTASRAGIVIDHPSTTSIMGSALVLASDDTYRLGTASYYHVVMNQAGRTQLFGGGSAGLTVDTNQNVGIGTTSPASLLQVGGAAASPHAAADDFVIAPAATDVGMTIRCNSNSGTGSIFFADTAANAQGTIRYNHNSDYMSFYSSGDYFFDTSAGSVGIGTTSPSAKLHINTTSGTAAIIDGSDDSTSLGSSPGLIIRQGDTNNDFSILKFEASGTGPLAMVGAKASTTGAYPNSVGELHFGVQNGSGTITAMRISGSNSGAVTIGAFTFPTADGTANQVLQTDGSGTLSWSSAGTGTISGSGTDNYIPRFNGSGALQDSSIIADDSGNITQIGGSPEYHFGTTSASHRNWRIAAQEVVDQGFEIASGTASAGSSAASDTYTTRFVIKGDTGYVGVGTTAPVKNIDVKYSSNNSASMDGSGLSGATAGNGILINNTATNVSSYANLDFRANDADGRIAFRYDAGNKGSFHFITDNDGGGFVRGMSIRSDGNVGIGVTSPSEKLHVDGAGYFEGGGVRDGGWHRGLEITTENNSYASLYFGGQSATKYSGIIWTSSTSGSAGASRGAQIWAGPDSATNTYLGFSTNNAVGTSSPTEKMRILGNGNVGIGTTSPAVKLHIAGGSEGSQGGLRIDHPENSTSVTSGYYQLYVYNTDTTNGNHAAIYFGDGSGGASSILSSKINDHSNNYGDMQFWTRGSGGSGIRLHIDQEGSVGIGTTSPSYPLQVQYAGGAAIGMQVKGTSNRAKLVVTDNDTSTYLIAEDSMSSIGRNDSLSASNLTINASGCVGIGVTNPSQKLDIRGGNIYIESGYKITWSNGDAEIIEGRTSNYSLALRTYDGSSAMVTNLFLKSGGNVGIGTETPAYPLDVKTASLGAMQVKGSGSNGLLIGEAAYSQSANYTGLKTSYMTGNQDYMIISGTATDGNTYVGAKSGNNLHLRAGGNNSTNEIVVSASTGITYKSDVRHEFSTGNVGIGTASPAHKFHVLSTDQGAALIDNNRSSTAANLSEASTLYSLSLKNRNAGSYLNFSGSDGYTTIQALEDSTTARNISLNPFGGYVGVGTTSPTTRLHINRHSGESWDGNIGLSMTGTMLGKIIVDSEGIKYRTIVSGDDHTFRNSGNATTLRIKDSGKLGIGLNNTSPNETADVVGSLKHGTSTDHEIVYHSTTGTIAGNTLTTINWKNGTSTLNRNYTYKIELYINNDTSTNSSAVYVLRDTANYHTDTASWNLRMVSRTGTSSNHVAVEVASAGTVIQVKHFHGSSSYPIGYKVTANKRGTQNAVGAAIFGADSMWQRDVSTLQYPDGQVQVLAGALSAPSYSFTGDVDTGMSRPTTNALNFVTGGSERVRIDANGVMLVGSQTSSGNAAQRFQVGNALASNSSAIAQMNGLVRITSMITHASGTGATAHSGVMPAQNNTGNLGNTDYRYYGLYSNLGNFTGNLTLAGDSASRFYFGNKIAMEGQISNNNLDLGENFANIRLRSSSDVFPTNSVNLGTSSSRWNTMYGVVGNFSGNVGIGVTPNTANKLEVNGQIRGTTAMFGDASLGNVAQRPVHIKVGGAAMLRLEDSTSSNLVYDISSDWGIGFVIRDETAGTNRLIIDQSTGDATFSNDVIVTGDLTVNGDTTTVNTTNLLVEDPLIVLAKNQTGTPTLDAGIVVERGDSNNAAMYWDESDDQFRFITTTETGSTAGNIAITDNADIKAKNATFTGTLTESSSITLKENIFDFTSPLEKISKVRPVKYNKKTNKDKKEIGLIAEELAEIFPELVENDKDGNPASVNYTRAVTVLFDGFKQMYKELKEIKEKIK